jgi:hypothetical protein
MNKERERRRLLARLAAERAGLLQGLLGLDEADLVGPFVHDDWTVKDILAHIAAWDRWEERVMRAMIAGATPDFSEVQDFAVSNAAFVAPWRERGLAEVLSELAAARREWVAWLVGLRDAEFFRKRAYAGHNWTFSEVPLQVQWEHDAEHSAAITSWRQAAGLTGHAGGAMSVLRAAVDAARDELLAAVALIPADERTSRPVCGDWTLKDLLGHIADWEWYAVSGLRRMPVGEPPPPLYPPQTGGEMPALDPSQAGGETGGESIERWNQAHAAARRDQPWERVWEDLGGAHRAFLEILAEMDPTALSRRFPWPWGEAGTVYRCATVFLGHDRDHAGDLRDYSEAESKG